jgi:sulfur carrier protein ThiS/ribosomal protein S8
MGLQFRRGIDSDRTGITPDIGEPIYITDTKQLYIGDGTTAGGVAVGGGTDSANVLDLIASTVDSAYIQARQDDIFRDSAFVTGIVDTVYIQARDRVRDSSFITDIVDSAYITARASTFDSNNAIGLITGYNYTTYDSNNTIGLVDSSYVQIRQTPQDFAYSSLTGTPNILDSANVVSLITANDQQRDSGFVTNIVDSAYVQLRQDFAYSSLTGTPTNVSSFTNDAGYTTYDSSNFSQQITAGSYATQTYVTTSVDSAIDALVNGAPLALDTLNELATALQNDSDALAALTLVVDTKLNTAGVTSLVDSAYVQARQILQDFAYSSLTGAPTNLSDFTNDTNYLDSTTVTGVIDAAYIQANQTTYDFLDSAEAIALIANQGYLTNAIDSAGVIALITANDQQRDSAFITGIVDSAYINARVNANLDSVAAINLIDSAYINARVSTVDSGQVLNIVDIAGYTKLDSTNVLDIIPDGTYRGLRSFEFTADSGDTVFTGADVNGNTLSYNPGNVQVAVNGILLRTTDYTVNAGTSITLTTAADSGDEISIFNVVAGGIDSTAALNLVIDGTYRGLRTYTFTADSGDTAFTGTDDFGNTLTYSRQALVVYVNGILLTDSVDYTALDGSTITLTNPADSADIITFHNIVAGGTDSALINQQILSYIDSAYIQARQLNPDQTLNTTDSVTFASIIVTGDLQVNGTTTTVNSEDLNVTDHMIYMNAGESAGSPTASIDVGWAANVNDDGSYAHVGMFRDATDNTFKVYEGYTLEPDAGAELNTAHASFSLAPFAARTLTGKYLGFDSDFNTKTISSLSNDANYLDSTTVQGVIDATYIQANQTTYDVLDSANVQSIVTSYNYSTYDSTNAAAQIEAYGYLTNAIDSVGVIALITANDQQRDSAFVTGIIDSAYVNARVNTVDSAQVLTIVDANGYTKYDSANTTALITSYGYSTYDSTNTLGLVDSAYVQERQIKSHAIGGKYRFDTSTTAGDPGSGDIRLSIDWTTGTEGNSYYAYVSETDKDGVGIAPLLDQLTVSTSTNKALVIIYKADAPTTNAKFYVTGQTDNGSYRTLDITYVDRDAWGQISNGDEIFMSLSIIGDKGDIAGSIDSAGVVSLVDSAYVQARQTPQDFAYSSLTGAPTNVSSFTNDAGYTTYDSSNFSQQIANGNYATQSYVTTSVDSAIDDLVNGAPLALDTLNELATALQNDSNALAALTTVVNTKLNSSDVTSLVDSTYVQARQILQDFAYSSLTGTPTNLSDFTNDTNYLDSTTVTGVIDASYIQANQTTYDFLDSAEAIALIATQGYLTDAIDSARITSMLAADSFSIGGTIIGDGKVEVFTSSGSPSYIDLYCEVSNLHRTRIQSDVHANYSGQVTLTAPTTSGTLALTSDIVDSAAIITLIQANDQQRDSAFVTGIIDSAYVAARTTAGTDSATVISLITSTVDSAYVALREANAGVVGGGLDSAAIINLVDSAYVQARQTTVSGGSGGGLDSDAVLNLIGNGTRKALSTFEYIVDSGATSVSGVDQYGATLSYTIQGIIVYVNGILLRDSDYTATNGSSITFTDALAQNDEVTVHNIAANGLDSSAVLNLIPDGTKQGLKTFTFTASLGDSTFSGVDDNGNTLAYNGSSVVVYANGILLVKGTDYQASNGTSISLTTAADSADIISVHNIVTAGIDSAATIGLIDSAYIAARSAPGTDSATVISIVQGLVDSAYVFARQGNTVGLIVDNFSFTADSAQTIFSGADNSSNTLKYIAGDIQVFRNGILLVDSDDYTASNGTSITLTSGANTGDNLSVTAFSSADQVVQLNTFEYTADSGATSFSGTDDFGNSLTYNVGNVLVHLNGILLTDSADYTANNGTTITLSTAADSADILHISAFGTATALNKWREATTSYTTEAGTKLIVDTSSGAITVTLPASPVFGDEVKIIDGTGNAGTNNITINRNSNRILGADSDFTLDVNRAAIDLVYYNVTQGWIVSGNS